MSRCGNKKAGIVDPFAEVVGGRYPAPAPRYRKAVWKQADGAAPQFGNIKSVQPPIGPRERVQLLRAETYHRQKSAHGAQLPPYTYSGENLAVCDFPLGGFGAGNVFFRGDGTLGGWTVVNQVAASLLPSPSPRCDPSIHCVCACACSDTLGG
jgi:hypothetical protein